MKNMSISAESKAHKMVESKPMQFLLIMGGIILGTMILDMITGITQHHDLLHEFTVRNLILNHVVAVIAAGLSVFVPWHRLKPGKNKSAE